MKNKDYYINVSKFFSLELIFQEVKKWDLNLTKIMTAASK